MSLFDRMADRWYGNNPVSQAAIMVRTLAPEMTTPADRRRADAYARPVLRHLKVRSHQWRSIEMIGRGSNIREAHAAELIICLNALVDAGHLVDGPESRFSYGVPNILGRIDHVDTLRNTPGHHLLPLTEEMTEALGPGGDRDRALALIHPLYEHFAQQDAGYSPGFAKVCSEMGLKKETDGVVLHLALGALAAHGRLVMLPSADLRGPRWQRPPTT